MHILRQLPPSYLSIVDVITNMNPFTSFLEAKKMLLLHEGSKETINAPHDSTLTSSMTLYSTSNNLGKSKNKWNKNRNNNLVAFKVGGNSTLYIGTNHIAGNTTSAQPNYASVLGSNPSNTSSFQIPRQPQAT